jgi:hypothetical protein
MTVKCAEEKIKAFGCRGTLQNREPSLPCLRAVGNERLAGGYLLLRIPRLHLKLTGLDQSEFVELRRVALLNPS